jgi:agarase
MHINTLKVVDRQSTLVFSGLQTMSDRISRTHWGGTHTGGFDAGGYFRVAERDGIFWLVDPDGGRSLSKGVNTVRFDQDHVLDTPRAPYAEACTRKYGSEAAWRAVAGARLVQWGFNTLGCWSDESLANGESLGLAVTSNLDLGMSFVRNMNHKIKEGSLQAFPDVFDTGFERHVRSRARELCAARFDDRRIIGWFIDNELRWGPYWSGPDELLTLFLGLRGTAPGRLAAVDWLRERYRDFQKFNAIWHTPAQSWETLDLLNPIGPPHTRFPVYQRDAKQEQAANHADAARAEFFTACDAFAGLVGQRYFETTCAAIKAADPNHLILGSRFAYVPPPGVIEAAATYCDVISINCYDLDPSRTVDAYRGTQKPCLIGEFSFRSSDSGLPNTIGAGPLVRTQAERAAAYRRYVAAALSQPAIVGIHWFEHADQPAEGRFDGENSNFGIVSINDEVYEELTQTMKSLNAEAEAIHMSAGRTS